MSTSFNSTLQLYNSFAEIYHEYKEPLRFEQMDWDNIKHESIKLRSTINHTITFERRVIRINMNMTGKTVFVRKYPEQKDLIPCEIIHEYNTYSLVRDIKTGYYFRIQSHLIEYPDKPQFNSIYEVSFYPLPLNHSFIVSYAIKYLRWQARYKLQTFSDHPIQFQILLDIINSSPLTYRFNQTHLISSDIHLSFNKNKTSSFTTTKTNTHLFSSINRSLIIDPYSTLTLPIQTPDIHIKTFFAYTLVLTKTLISLNNMISIGVSNTHKFQRFYRFTNITSFLPTGHLLLYDSSDNILTGEWYLPTLTELDKYEFKLGEDSDVILTYNRTITASNPKTNSSLIITKILIQNYKQQKISIQFKSICDLTMICLFYDDRAHLHGSRLRYELVLKPKSELVFSFTTVRLF